jgi:hypothetical protein
MKKKYLFLLLPVLVLGLYAFAGGELAIPGVIKNTLILHMRSTPTHTPSASWPEVALNVADGSLHTWNRTGQAWRQYPYALNYAASTDTGYTLVWNGTRYAPGTPAYESYTIISDSIGNDTITTGVADYLFKPGANQSSHTIALPATPVDQATVNITFYHSVTALTIGGNGRTIIGTAPTTAAVGLQLHYKFYGGTTNRWIRLLD